MKFLRHALLVVLLLLTQTGALTHAVEHLRIDTDAPASHPCAHCIAVQGLDAALISTPPAAVFSAPPVALLTGLILAACVVAVPAPRARAPPVA